MGAQVLRVAVQDQNATACVLRGEIPAVDRDPVGSLEDHIAVCELLHGRTLLHLPRWVEEEAAAARQDKGQRQNKKATLHRMQARYQHRLSIILVQTGSKDILIPLDARFRGHDQPYIMYKSKSDQ
jgi:hypothetical protein